MLDDKAQSRAHATPPPQTYRHTGFFVLRTPLLPFSEFLAWGDGPGADGGRAAPESQDDPSGDPERDRAWLRERLAEVMSRRDVWDAVFVACPDLDQFLEGWRREPDTKRGRNTERALVRYFSRMAGRATPFGLFAGVSVGGVGAKTDLSLPPAGQYRRHTRLSLDYLQQLFEALGREGGPRREAVFHPNQSLYISGGRVRYVESRPVTTGRSYYLVAADENEYVTAVLRRAEGGATLRELISALLPAGVEPPEAERFVHLLVESQILLPASVPALTGEVSLKTLAEELESPSGHRRAAQILREAGERLEVIDRGGPGARPESYRSVARVLDGLPAEHPFGRLFQVDMTKPSPSLSLGEELVSEIVGGLRLARILSARRGGGTLERFRRAFSERYEEQEVPLLEALDEELGVGFNPPSGPGDDASPLLRGVAFPRRAPSLTPWGEREKFLLRKLTEALARGSEEVAIEPAELSVLEAGAPARLPDALSVVALLAARSQADLERGSYRILLDHVDGPSGACLLGRFCHADPVLRRRVEEHLRAEEALGPGAVFAEVVHLPDGRVGNILCRPVLRGHEIPYLGRSGAPPDRQIQVADLRVCVREGRVVLRSASLGREVIPRLSTAHNYTWRNLSVYTFLCALQEQDVSVGPFLDWGPLGDAHFLPRVVSGRLVLSLARWRMGPEELRRLGQARGPELRDVLRRWRELRGLPRIVALAEGDNTLPVDFDNALSAESFVHLVRGRDSATLVEFFPAADELCVRGPEGAFVHEIVLPLVRAVEGPPAAPSESAPRQSVPSTPPRPAETSFKRVFTPGSEWLYAKLYVGAATADQVLRELVRPLVDEVTGKGADRWFFVRYGDPDWHLRLRFHGRPGRLHGEVLPRLEAAVGRFQARGQVRLLQLDTYAREVERYGGAEGVCLAERFFHLDSLCALELVEMLERGDAGLDERWRLTLRGIDMMLEDFGFDLAARHRLASDMRAEFAAEFDAGEGLQGQLADKFRRERRELEALLECGPGSDHPLSPGVAVLRSRSEAAATLLGELRAALAGRRLALTLEGLAPSYVHMFANRLLRSAHRAQELILYDFLERLYSSRLARAGFKPHLGRAAT